jgi:hypothetical protein
MTAGLGRVGSCRKSDKPYRNPTPYTDCRKGLENGAASHADARNYFCTCSHNNRPPRKPLGVPAPFRQADAKNLFHTSLSVEVSRGVSRETPSFDHCRSVIDGMNLDAAVLGSISTAAIVVTSFGSALAGAVLWCCRTAPHWLCCCPLQRQCPPTLAPIFELKDLRKT